MRIQPLHHTRPFISVLRHHVLSRQPHLARHRKLPYRLCYRFLRCDFLTANREDFFPFHPKHFRQFSALFASAFWIAALSRLPPSRICGHFRHNPPSCVRTEALNCNMILLELRLEIGSNITNHFPTFTCSYLLTGNQTSLNQQIGRSMLLRPLSPSDSFAKKKSRIRSGSLSQNPNRITRRSRVGIHTDADASPPDRPH